MAQMNNGKAANAKRFHTAAQGRVFFTAKRLHSEAQGRAAHPGSPTAPRTQTPQGFSPMTRSTIRDDVRPNAWGCGTPAAFVVDVGDVYPGCAAAHRPWAVECNRSAVMTAFLTPTALCSEAQGREAHPGSPISRHTKP